MSDLFSNTHVDMTQAHPGRMYDYLLGGTANFKVDQEAVHASTGAVGGIENARATVKANRGFLVRVVRYLAHEAGVRQFLDLGTGIPTEPNVADVAQQAAPDCRVVYVDNDVRHGTRGTQTTGSKNRSSSATAASSASSLPAGSWSTPVSYSSTSGAPTATPRPGRPAGKPPTTPRSATWSPVPGETAQRVPTSHDPG